MPHSLLPLSSPPLSGWFVVSLRPVGQHRRLLHAARALGADGLSLPGSRLAAREDTLTRAALDGVLQCGRVIFTSPSAVRFSVRLRTLRVEPHQSVFALGEATRTALNRAGISNVQVPEHADSESLLTMPEMQTLRSIRTGIVTAPDGRGLLQRRLHESGAILVIAEVYERAPARLTRAHAKRLMEAQGCGAVCITSGEALGHVLDAIPEAARIKLRQCTAIVSSARLEAIAREAGFKTIVRASAPAPRELLAALWAHAKQQGFR